MHVGTYPPWKEETFEMAQLSRETNCLGLGHKETAIKGDPS